jgi:hypothetical protein
MTMDLGQQDMVAYWADASSLKRFEARTISLSRKKQD